VEYEDAATLTRIPGCRQEDRRAPDHRDARSHREAARDSPGRQGGKVDAGPRQEAVDALIALGYKPAEVNKLIGALDTDGQSAEDIIRSALKQVAG
jgi:Holliday junction DNA helicase RuvA